MPFDKRNTHISWIVKSYPKLVEDLVPPHTRQENDFQTVHYIQVLIRNRISTWLNKKPHHTGPDGDHPLHISTDPPCLGKHVKPLVSAVIRRSLAVVMGSQKSKSVNHPPLPRGIVLSSNCAVEVRIGSRSMQNTGIQLHPVRLESQPQHGWAKAWQIEMDPREVMTFRVSYITALPYENEQGPEYGDEWIYFYDEEGNTHTMNFSTLPQETRGMIFGDAYFYLYTRRNTEAEKLETPEENQLFTSQYFNSSNEIKVVTHGWFSHEKTEWLQEIKDAFLRKYDFNVITVDWSELAKNPAYPWSAFSTRYVGKKTATLLDSIARTYQVDGKVMHLMGHSLGSHVMGYTALFSNQRIHRITGLDPARPLFELPLMAPDYRLEKSDAEFVDIIHSCGGVYGYWRSHGHADFYPNNGRAKQPGCEGAQQVIEGCSHGRSTLFFAESIDSKIPFVAYPCENWNKFENGDCKENSVNMGYPVSTNIRGDYYLYTNSEPEFARGED